MMQILSVLAAFVLLLLALLAGALYLYVKLIGGGRITITVTRTAGDEDGGQEVGAG